jgi:hypothetical protein
VATAFNVEGFAPVWSARRLLDEDLTRVSASTPSWSLASAAFMSCMAAIRASRSGTSMTMATWAGFCGSTKVRMLVRLGDRRTRPASTRTASAWCFHIVVTDHGEHGGSFGDPPAETGSRRLRLRCCRDPAEGVRRRPRWESGQCATRGTDRRLRSASHACGSERDHHRYASGVDTDRPEDHDDARRDPEDHLAVLSQRRPARLVINSRHNPRYR